MGNGAASTGVLDYIQQHRSAGSNSIELKQTASPQAAKTQTNRATKVFSPAEVGVGDGSIQGRHNPSATWGVHQGTKGQPRLAAANNIRRKVRDAWQAQIHSQNMKHNNGNKKIIAITPRSTGTALRPHHVHTIITLASPRAFPHCTKQTPTQTCCTQATLYTSHAVQAPSYTNHAAHKAAPHTSRATYVGWGPVYTAAGPSRW